MKKIVLRTIKIIGIVLCIIIAIVGVCFAIICTMIPPELVSGPMSTAQRICFTGLLYTIPISYGLFAVGILDSL